MYKNMLIKEFYKNQEIFLTGGSGYLGKALIEKLMRSCSGFSKIFVLLRDKKGKNCQERLEDILQTKLFDRARKEQPESFNRIEAISGDCMELGLGIKEENLKKLKNVSIIFHSAASVRFDDPLKYAIILNTRGTWELLKIAETLKKLKVFAHISTTYCNSDRAVVEEKVYKTCVDWRDTIKLAETLDKESLDIFNLKYNDFKPNTYTFTKALAEKVVNDYKDKLPILIYRPSIVINCLDDPIPGWVDNFNGPIGMLIASGIGILRTHDNDGKKLTAIVPVDIVIRGLIISTYKKGIENAAKSIFFSCSSKYENELDVYNCAIDSISPISTYDLTEMGRLRILENPFERTLWVPDGTFTNCPFIFYVKFFFVQLLMSLIIDILLRLNGKKPMLMKLQRRLRYAMKAIAIFIKTEWHFKVEKFLDLENFVPKAEYDDFAFLEKSHINYKELVIQGIRGGKEFLLNEDPDSSPGARKRLLILKVLHYGIISISYFLLARFLFNWTYKKVLEVST